MPTDFETSVIREIDTNKWWIHIGSTKAVYFHNQQALAMVKYALNDDNQLKRSDSFCVRGKDVNFANREDGWERLVFVKDEESKRYHFIGIWNSL